MSNDQAAGNFLDATGLAARYPSQTFYLGQVFRHTTNSYKLVWFLSILSLLKHAGGKYPRVTDVLREMAVIAWPPVCLFRLSLGCKDQLQLIVQNIQQTTGFSPTESPDAIRRFVQSSPEAQADLAVLNRFVPTRFLAPWFADDLRNLKDCVKDRLIKTLVRSRMQNAAPPLYSFGGDPAEERLEVNDSWRAFLLDNFGLVQAFAEYHFALYLQERNPNVPGIVKKLRVPAVRQLTAARDFWQMNRERLDQEGRAAEFQDIYTGNQLGGRFAIDHFLPWSFVVHDMLWNLSPVEPSVNSSKSDILPDFTAYLPRLARLHHRAINIARNRPRFLEDYTDCFRLDASSLLALDEESLANKYREVVMPQAQIAINQGFRSGWRHV